ncbi:nuclear transcription factor Y subunit B-1-like [Malania oleifera]|uniref:nuclear transcription factor Y subunit B-1-like n=1 Tax=Malania oleifera TaxID=397392 RepID=UPI0025AEA4BC|nr:nuclear transcription factor Y subunit B-1-like [Malania oleifera]
MGDNAGASASSSTEEGCIKEQERLLPIANVGRIMKQILPPNVKVSKEAKETMQECASEFIGFVTGEASDKCRKERRKTVNGDDICWALGTLGFDNYAGPLRRYLTKYRELEGDHQRADNQDKVSNTNNTNSTSAEERDSRNYEPSSSNENSAQTLINLQALLAPPLYPSGIKGSFDSFRPN